MANVNDIGLDKYIKEVKDIFDDVHKKEDKKNTAEVINTMMGYSKAKVSAIHKSELNVIDREWVKGRLSLSDNDIDSRFVRARYWTTASTKMAVTSLGGGLAINMRPGYTPYADIRQKGRITGRPDVNVVGIVGKNAEYGMGRYYSESQDDNLILAYMQYGTPKFNSMFSFYFNAVSYTDAVFAETGRRPIAYEIGKWTTRLIMLAAFPILTIGATLISYAYTLFSGNNALKYYYMEEQMMNYWGTVNLMVTQLSTELGLLVPELTKDGRAGKRIGTSVEFDRDDFEYMRKLLPNIFTDSNGIDVTAIVSRAQQMATHDVEIDMMYYAKDHMNPLKKVDTDEVEIIEKYLDLGEKGNDNVRGSQSFKSKIAKIKGLDKNDTYWGRADVKRDVRAKAAADVANRGGLSATAIANNIKANKDSKTTDPGGNSPVITESMIKNSEATDGDGGFSLTNWFGDTFNDAKKGVDSVGNSISNWARTGYDTAVANIQGGGMHAIYSVEYAGTKTISFSNSTTEIAAEGMLKSATDKMRDIRYNLSGGNVMGGFIDKAVGAMSALAAGAGDGIIGGAGSAIAAVLSGAYVVLPKRPSDSSVNVSEASYTMKLRSPYNNPISDLTNMWIPAIMLIAATAPKATGEASYGLPPLCNLFVKGMENINLGMISSLSITPAVSNLPYSRNRTPRGLDISFSVVDLEPFIFSPSSSGVLADLKMQLRDHTGMSRYFATIGGRDVIANKHLMPRAKRGWSRLRQTFTQSFTASNIGMHVGTSLYDIAGGVFRDMDIAGKQ